MRSGRVLNDRGLRIELQIEDGRVLLEMSDSATLRFRIDPALFQGVFGEESLQLSILGNYCRVERVVDRIHFEFGLEGEMGSQCEIPANELSDALTWARETSRLDVGQDPNEP